MLMCFAPKCTKRAIRERPAEVEDRAVPGHWEGDLLSGTNNTHIATLAERHTRFTTLLKVPSKDTATVVAALSKHARKLPQQLRYREAKPCYGDDCQRDKQPG
jgi:IS30 family transposase